MMNEAKKEDDSEEESEEEEKEEKSEKKGDDELVGEMTEDELKNLIMSVFDEMGIEAGPGGDRIHIVFVQSHVLLYHPQLPSTFHPMAERH